MKSTNENSGIPTMANSNSRIVSKTPPVTSPPSTLAAALRKHLNQEFLTRKRRSKYTGPDLPFRIDDHNTTDTWTWQITVGAINATPPSLILLLQSLPQNAEVGDFALSRGGRVILKGAHATYVIPLGMTDGQAIRKLAGTIRSMETVRWQWLTQRAADCLIHLANHLGRFPAVN
jgi:hypothetical protein